MEDKIDRAAVNGPGTLTLSGDTDCIHRLVGRLTEADIFHRELRVEVPYHSYLMDSITDELILALDGMQPSPPSTLLYSTVTGEAVYDIAYDGPYWAANVREPVAFMKAINGLLDEGSPPSFRSAHIRCCRQRFANARAARARMYALSKRFVAGTPRRQACTRPSLSCIQVAFSWTGRGTTRPGVSSRCPTMLGSATAIGWRRNTSRSDGSPGASPLDP
jgi:hypothetical protein